MGVSKRPLSKKSIVISEVYNMCKLRNDYTFTNVEVRKVCTKLGFGNQYDATKFDSREKLPNVLVENDVFVVHTGQGKHKFVSGINIGYHKFEPISPANTKKWPYSPDKLDKISNSASNALSVAYNQRILHDFLYKDTQASPNIYNSHRTNVSFDYKIGDNTATSNSTQIEIDFITELQGRITIFESKVGEQTDFNVFQIYNPCRHYMDTPQLRANSIECCYVLHRSDKICLYLYSFADKKDPGSIEHRQNAAYLLDTSYKQQ